MQVYFICQRFQALGIKQEELLKLETLVLDANNLPLTILGGVFVRIIGDYEDGRTEKNSSTSLHSLGSQGDFPER